MNGAAVGASSETYYKNKISEVVDLSRHTCSVVLRNLAGVRGFVGFVISEQKGTSTPQRTSISRGKNM